MLEIKNDGYQVWNDEVSETVFCAGSFRFNGVNEYQPIIDLFNSVASKSAQKLALDLSKLEFLNSSGINALSRFIISLRSRPQLQVTMKGSKKIAWQSKSLPNLVRLLPSLQLEYLD